MSKKEKRQKTRRNHRVSARDKGVGVLLLLIVIAMIMVGAVALAATGVFEPAGEARPLEGVQPLEFATKPPLLGRVAEFLIPSARAEESGEAASEEIKTESDLEALLSSLAEQETEAEVPESQRVTVKADDLSVNENLPDEWVNVLLMATDSRDIAKNNGRTDVMIVASINPSTGEIKLSSLARDMYVQLAAGAGHNRINAAYSFGGPLLALKTVNEIFELNCKYYAVVNFKSMAAIVDALGGVDINLEGLEYYYINYNVAVSEDYEGFPKSKTRRVLTEADAGVSVHLDGLQAVSYARIRKLDSDFVRVERQQRVVQAIYRQLGTLDLMQLTGVMTAYIGKVNTNVTLAQAASLLSSVMGYSDVQVQTLRVPADGAYRSDMLSDTYYIIPKLERCRQDIAAFLGS